MRSVQPHHCTEWLRAHSMKGPSRLNKPLLFLFILQIEIWIHKIQCNLQIVDTLNKRHLSIKDDSQCPKCIIGLIHFNLLRGKITSSKASFIWRFYIVSTSGLPVSDIPINLVSRAMSPFSGFGTPTILQWIRYPNLRIILGDGVEGSLCWPAPP